MANERLRDAMDRERVDVAAVSRAAGVDVKTVQRWLAGRTPHPRHRWIVAKLLHEDEFYLWPEVQRPNASSAGTAEIVNAYPFRSDFPVANWWALFTRAERHVDLLGYTLYFLPLQHPLLIDALKEKCAAGCKVRVVIADPDSRHVADRDAEEDLAMTLVVRIRTSLKYFREMLDCPGFELRMQDSPLYNSIFRYDDEMLVTPHLHAAPGSAAPMLHIRRLGPNGMFSRFAAHFESIWGTTTPVDQLGLQQPIRSES